MPDRVKDRVADMMRWHRRTVIAVAALLVFALGRFFAPAIPELRVVVGLGLLAALLATVGLGLITIGYVFLAGRAAFGTGPGWATSCWRSCSSGWGRSSSRTW